MIRDIGLVKFAYCRNLVVIYSSNFSLLPLIDSSIQYSYIPNSTVQFTLAVPVLALTRCGKR